MEVARGRRPPDTVLRNAHVVDLWTRQVRRASVGVVEGWIAHVGSEPSGWELAGEVVDLDGLYIVPGYLEPHCHPDFMYSPLTLGAEVLPRGTTGLFCDTLFLVTVMGPTSVADALDLTHEMPVRMWWAAPSCLRTRLAEGEPAYFWPTVLEVMRRDDTALLAEVTRWSDAIDGDPKLLTTILSARRRGLRVDGHSAGARGLKAAAYVAAGITADHEPIAPGELLEKLELGLWGMIRHSSLRPDLPALVPLLVERPWLADRLMLTTDGPSPDYVVETGYLDALVKMLIDLGVEPLSAYKMASLNVALYYRLDDRLGLVAPGRAADLLVLEDLRQPLPTAVMVNGQWVAREGIYLGATPPVDQFAHLAHLCFADRLPSVHDVLKRLRRVLPSSVPVLRLESAVITRLEEGEANQILVQALTPEEDLTMAWLMARDGVRVTVGFIRGLGRGILGLASSLNTACEYLVIGKDMAAMQQALDRLLELGGGIVVVGPGGTTAEVVLPIGGRMSPRPLQKIAEEYRGFRDFLEGLGYAFHDPAYTLYFLSGDLLPDVRLTPAGVWDVKRRTVLLPPVVLSE